MSVYMCFVVTCWERADLLALVCGVFCEFVTFPLVSWVRCGTWLYRFLIFAPLLTFMIEALLTWVSYIFCTSLNVRLNPLVFFFIPDVPASFAQTGGRCTGNGLPNPGRDISFPVFIRQENQNGNLNNKYLALMNYYVLANLNPHIAQMRPCLPPSFSSIRHYSKTCVKRPLSKRQKIGFSRPIIASCVTQPL